MRILQEIKDYYSEKILKYGPVPEGVDWNSMESQEMRFKELTKIINLDKFFSVLDYGCGYGALYLYLKENFKEFQYTGYDISEEMIKTAKLLHKSDNLTWLSKLNLSGANYDFVIASGIYNVKLETSSADWEYYIFQSLEEINQLANRAFSFNILTAYSDSDKRKDYLYYGNPAVYFDYCRRKFSKYISLLHDYPLFEFTVLVRKILNV